MMVWQFNFQTMTETVTSTSDCIQLWQLAAAACGSKVYHRLRLLPFRVFLTAAVTIHRYRYNYHGWAATFYFTSWKVLIFKRMKIIGRIRPNFVKSFQFFAQEAKKSLRQASSEGEGGVSGLIKTILLFLFSFFWRY